jgi:hypothetical protein
VKAAAKALVETFVAAKSEMRELWDKPQTFHGTSSKLPMNVDNAGEKRNRGVSSEDTIWLVVQYMQSATPLFTIFSYRQNLGRRTSANEKANLRAVVAGQEDNTF